MGILHLTLSHKKKRTAAILVILMLVCQACGEAPDTTSSASPDASTDAPSMGGSSPTAVESAAPRASTANATITPLPPTLTPEPAPPPLRLDGWEGVEIRTLCLETSEYYAPYGATDAQQPEEQMQTLLPLLLEKMGIEVEGPDGVCSAHMQIRVDGWPFDETYNNEQGGYTCYFHAIRGEIVLVAADQQISFPLEWEDVAPQRIALGACETPPQPEEHFPAIWQREVMKVFHQIWGVEAYFLSQTLTPWAAVWGVGQTLKPYAADQPAIRARLMDEDRKIRVMAVNLLGNLPDPAVALPDLIPLLEDASTDVRIAVLSALAGIGSSAKEVVPRLIPLVEDKTLGWLASETLGAITGQMLGQDAQAWQDWWQANHVLP